MKKMGCALMIMMVMCLLSSCGLGKRVLEIEYQGTTYLLDLKTSTISDGTYRYKYERSRYEDETTMKFTYPDDSWYRVDSETVGLFGPETSDDYDPERYASGQVLCAVLEQHEPNKFFSTKTVVGILMVLVGIFAYASPEASWFLGRGWQYKNVKPSKAALAVNQVGGVILMIAGVITMLV